MITATPASQESPRPLVDPVVLIVLTSLPIVGLVSGPSYAALIFSLAAIGWVYTLGVHKTLIPIDQMLLALGIGYILFGLTTSFWSINQNHTLSVIAQMAGIVILSLIFYSQAKTISIHAMAKLPQFMALATLAGVVIMVIDSVNHYPIQHWVDPRGLASKYNRGVSYLILIIWPLLAILWVRRDIRLAAMVALATSIIVLVSPNTTSKVLLVVSPATLVIAGRWPQTVAKAMSLMTIIGAMSFPFILRLIEPYRMDLVTLIKSSAYHRLEIWDYMSLRVLEKPLMGWGLGSSKLVPVYPQEIKGYIYADGTSIYPHNQFLQLWVETGAVGVAIGLIFCVVVLYRITTLSIKLRPFAYAAYVSAMVIACAGFSLETDSWWAALSASAFLFGLFNRFDGVIPTLNEHDS